MAKVTAGKIGVDGGSKTAGRVEDERRTTVLLCAAVVVASKRLAKVKKKRGGSRERRRQARHRFIEAGRGGAPMMRDVGAERLRLAVDWHGESGREGNARTGGARWSVTEEGRRRGGSCLAELGRSRKVRGGGRAGRGKEKGQRPAGEKGLRAKMKKGGEINEETFFFLFLEFFKCIFKWI